MSLRMLWKHFGEMKHYFIASTLVFAAGIYIGFSQADQFQAYLSSQLEGIGQVVDLIEKQSNSQLLFFLLIFINNTFKSIFVIFSGALLGIFPIFFLVINGMILGFLAALQEPNQLWSTITLGILPHGIIEIPAILIAAAYGLRFGMLILKLLFGLMRPGGSGAGQELRSFMKITVPLMIFLTVALFIAATIESTLTYWLMKP
jgi:stage II sporulation protein M